MRLAFLGCGFITRVHSRHLRFLGGIIEPSYASRDGLKAAAFCARYRGACSYGDYASALADPKVKKSFADGGMDEFSPGEETPEAAGALLEREIKLWGDVIHANKIAAAK